MKTYNELITVYITWYDPSHCRSWEELSEDLFYKVGEWQSDNHFHIPRGWRRNTQYDCQYKTLSSANHADAKKAIINLCTNLCDGESIVVKELTCNLVVDIDVAKLVYFATPRYKVTVLREVVDYGK